MDAYLVWPTVLVVVDNEAVFARAVLLAILESAVDPDFVTL